MRFAFLLSGLIVAGVGFRAVEAQEKTSAPTTETAPVRSPAENAIRASVKAYVDAFNTGNAKALAAQFTPDAHVVDREGTVIEGRDAIEREFIETLAARPGLTIAVTIDSIRPLGPETAIEDGVYTLTPRKGEAQSVSGRYTVVHVKRDGKWLQATVRESAVQDSDTDRRSHLKELEWLVGEWVDESAAAVVATSCRWAEKKNFLIRSFKVQMKGREAMTGMQVIGWDPLTRQIKSWVFDSEGGHGDALWSRDGKRWVIKSQGVLHDGKPASVTQVMTRVDQDTYKLKTVDRTDGDVALPDSDEYVIVRKPPEPK